MTNRPSSAQWSIADVERDTGLGKDTLRVWERRYGFPQPTRDAKGERRYDEAQLERLRLLKRLLDNGHRPRHTVALPLRRLQNLAFQLGSAAQTLPPALPGDADTPAPGSSASGATAHLDARWLQWLQANQIDALRQALRQHLLHHGLASTIENLLSPLSTLVGDAWLAGTLSVYQEHLFTEVVQTLLREAMAMLEQTRTEGARVPRVVLATLPQEKHSLGLLMAECFLALEECECRALGAGTPLPELVQAAVHLQADVVALSFSAHAAPQEVVHSLRQLREQLVSTVDIWVGGSAPVLYTRRCPPGVAALRRAQDLAQQVSLWRRVRGVLD